MKVATGWPPGHTSGITVLRWVEKLEERSGGRVKAEVYEGTLGKAPEFYDMVKDGVVDAIHRLGAISQPRVRIMKNLAYRHALTLVSSRSPPRLWGPPPATESMFAASGR